MSNIVEFSRCRVTPSSYEVFCSARRNMLEALRIWASETADVALLNEEAGATARAVLSMAELFELMREDRS